jgi:hypothetical protein
MISASQILTGKFLLSLPGGVVRRGLRGQKSPSVAPKARRKFYYIMVLLMIFSISRLLKIQPLSTLLNPANAPDHFKIDLFSCPK